MGISHQLKGITSFVSAKGVFSFRNRLKSWFGLLRREVYAAQEVLEAPIAAPGLLQFCILRFRFLQDGEIAVSVFPEGEEVGSRSASLGNWEKALEERREWN
jgi:hypothetical protein